MAEADDGPKSDDRSNPYGREIPADWTEHRIVSRRVADITKFNEHLKGKFGEDKFLMWVKDDQIIVWTAELPLTRDDWINC